MAEPAPTNSVFMLDVALGEHAPSIGRLFLAVVLRTAGVDEEIVEDAKLAISEALTAATLAGRERAQVEVDTASGKVQVSPLTDGDLAGDGFDVIGALFPASSAGESVQFTLPLDSSLP